jgi:hypothetical protein
MLESECSDGVGKVRTSWMWELNYYNSTSVALTFGSVGLGGKADSVR